MGHALAYAGAALAALAAVVLVIVLAGGDEEKPAEPAPHGPPTTGVTAPTETQRSERTETVEDLTDTTPRPDPLRAEVERAVFALVEAVELGRPPSGVDVSGLPTSDELSVERTRIAGDRAAVTLAGGTVVRLRRSGGEWRPVSVERRARRVPDGTSLFRQGRFLWWPPDGPLLHRSPGGDPRGGGHRRA